jgi:hypothetical protein
LCQSELIPENFSKKSRIKVTLRQRNYRAGRDCPRPLFFVTSPFLRHLERHVLLAGHTLHRVYFDCGYDLAMFTYRSNGEAEPGLAFFQVKATDQLPLLWDGKTFSWPVSRRDLRLWLEETFPVVLVVYDGQRDRAYWLYVQRYFADWRTAELFAAGETINVHIPLRSRISQRSITRIAGFKRDVHEQVYPKERFHG